MPTKTSASPALSCAVGLDDVSRSYGRGDSSVRALRHASLTCQPGTWTAIMGPSGSGKSTLLHCAAGLERVSSGTVWLAGRDITRASDRDLTLLRRRDVGFVFQSFNLMGALTAEQNVALPFRLSGQDLDRGSVRDVLEQVGLGDRARHRPRELSGGQQQRVALARALVTRPAVLFADEPTGALDSTSARTVLELLRRMVDSEGQTVVMVTHDPSAASYADRVVLLADGTVRDELGRSDSATIAARLTRLEG
jgi:putative ABC transport system ATP-binding protein